MLYKILYNESYTVSFFFKELAMTRTVTCISDIVPGDIFKVNGSVWEYQQAYNIAIPCLVDDNGSIVMLDTYQVNKCYTYDKACEHINNVITDAKIGAYAVNSVRFGYYHKCSSALHDSDFADGIFEFWFNVNEFEECKRSEAMMYADEDLHYSVKLYHEHGYSWTYGDTGICVKRKNASKLPERVLSSILSNDILCEAYFTKPYVSWLVIDKLDDLKKAYVDAGKQCNSDETRQQDYIDEVKRMYRTLVAVEYVQEAQKQLDEYMDQVTEQQNELPLSDLESKCFQLLEELS